MVVEGLLARIAASVRRQIEAARERRPEILIWQDAQKARPVRGFEAALRAGPAPAVIAEFKRASPSGGALRPDGDPVQVAAQYAAGGAAALSVLTESDYFNGSIDDLRRVAAASPLPVLRKEFVLDPYQVVEARAAGADAVLLVTALVEAAGLEGLLRLAGTLGMAALVEVHDEAELRIALGCGARLVGINNRNLKTLEVDRETTRRLAPRVPAGATLVSESGLRTPQHLRDAAACGAHAVLVGESLLREEDPGKALERLRG